MRVAGGQSKRKGVVGRVPRLADVFFQLVGVVPVVEGDSALDECEATSAVIKEGGAELKDDNEGLDCSHRLSAHHRSGCYASGEYESLKRGCGNAFE